MTGTTTTDSGVIELLAPLLKQGSSAKLAAALAREIGPWLAVPSRLSAEERRLVLACLARLLADPRPEPPTHIALHNRSHTCLWAGDDGWLYFDQARKVRHHFTLKEGADYRWILDLEQLRRGGLLLTEIPRKPRKARP